MSAASEPHGTSSQNKLWETLATFHLRSETWTQYNRGCVDKGAPCIIGHTTLFRMVRWCIRLARFSDSRSHHLRGSQVPHSVQVRQNMSDDRKLPGKHCLFCAYPFYPHSQWRHDVATDFIQLYKFTVALDSTICIHFHSIKITTYMSIDLCIRVIHA